MENISRDLIADETQTAKKTIANHGREIELLATMLNLYINGFSMTGSLNDQNTDTNWVWLFLLTRSFHSLRCSVGLMQKGYYAQAMALLRMVTENYFLCGNAKVNPTIADGILRNKPNRPDGTTRFNYKKLADDMGARVMYEKDYAFECKFSHFTALSAGIMTIEIDSHSRELTPVPVYNKVLFLACCELALKNGRLMSQFVYELLHDLSEEKADNWLNKSTDGIKEIDHWLTDLKQK
ncbi:hypothetical protein ES703_104006 [subsurface metagenome]